MPGHYRRHLRARRHCQRKRHFHGGVWPWGASHTQPAMSKNTPPFYMMPIVCYHLTFVTQTDPLAYVCLAAPACSWWAYVGVSKLAAGVYPGVLLAGSVLGLAGRHARLAAPSRRDDAALAEGRLLLFESFLGNFLSPSACFMASPDRARCRQVSRWPRPSRSAAELAGVLKERIRPGRALPWSRRHGNCPALLAKTQPSSARRSCAAARQRTGWGPTAADCSRVLRSPATPSLARRLSPQLGPKRRPRINVWGFALTTPFGPVVSQALTGWRRAHGHLGPAGGLYAGCLRHGLAVDDGGCIPPRKAACSP